MKNSNYLAKLAISIAAPAICTWLVAGRDSSAELLFGAYTLAGLYFLITAESVSRSCYYGGTRTAGNNRNWVQAALHPHRAHRAEKIPA